MGKFMDAMFGAKAPEPMEQREDLGGPDVPVAPTGPDVTPPARSRGLAVTDKQAMGISMVYRAISIHAIAGKQMGIQEWKSNAENDEAERVSASLLIRQPDSDMPRSAFVELTIVSLACTGNAYWHLTRDKSNRVTNARVLDPSTVQPKISPLGRAAGFTWNGKDWKPDEIKHLKLLRVPGQALGMGPIQAAQSELRGAIDLNEYAGNFFSDGSQPTGVLKTDLMMNAEQTKQYKDAFKASQAGKRDVVVLGQGLDYKPIFLSPSDAQFLENKQYTTTEIARMFGTPSSLMLANVQGTSQTYQNVEQDWLGFVRFSNMQYLIEIEDALTDLLPRGRFAKFNVEALLRSDTTTRYSAYKSGIEAGWLLRSEVRKTEKMEPVAGIDDKPVAAPKQEVTENENG